MGNERLFSCACFSYKFTPNYVSKMNTDLKKSFFFLCLALLLFPFSEIFSLLFAFLGVVKWANFFAPKFPLLLKRTIPFLISSVDLLQFLYGDKASSEGSPMAF